METLVPPALLLVFPISLEPGLWGASSKGFRGEAAQAPSCTDIHWPVRGQELGAAGVCPIHADLAFQIPATPPRRTLPAPWKALVA